MTKLLRGLSLSLSQSMSLTLYVLSPVQLRRGSDRAALVGTWCPPRVNPPHETSTFSLVYQLEH